MRSFGSGDKTARDCLVLHRICTNYAEMTRNLRTQSCHRLSLSSPNWDSLLRKELQIFHGHGHGGERKIKLTHKTSWYEKHAGEKYPDSSSTILIGLCVGQLSATAVSLTKSLVELIPFAVEAVRIAFRVGTVVTNVKNELEPGHEDQTWAMSREKSSVDEEVLRRIQEELVSTVGTYGSKIE